MPLTRPALKCLAGISVSIIAFTILCIIFPMANSDPVTQGRAMGCLLCFLLVLGGLACFLVSLDSLHHENIHAIKILAFIALLGFFIAMGGFSTNSINRHADRHPSPPSFLSRRGSLPEGVVNLATFICYAVGAAVAVWGNKLIGLMDPTSLRPLFILGGIALMLIALLPLFNSWMSDLSLTQFTRPVP